MVCLLLKLSTFTNLSINSKQEIIGLAIASILGVVLAINFLFVVCFGVYVVISLSLKLLFGKRTSAHKVTQICPEDLENKAKTKLPVDGIKATSTDNLNSPSIKTASKYAKSLKRGKNNFKQDQNLLTFKKPISPHRNLKLMLTSENSVQASPTRSFSPLQSSRQIPGPVQGRHRISNYSPGVTTDNGLLSRPLPTLSSTTGDSPPRNTTEHT